MKQEVIEKNFWKLHSTTATGLEPITTWFVNPVIVPPLASLAEWLSFDSQTE